MASFSPNKAGNLVGAIDEGTSSTRFLVFSALTSRLTSSYQIDIKTHYPHQGWVEQNPLEILDAVVHTMKETIKILNDKCINPEYIRAIGITNQRETTVLWDPLTGKPLHNAIVWLDTRTSTTLEKLLEKIPDKNKDHFKRLCGLPLSTYFSALKIRWLMDNIPEVSKAIAENRCLFGTIDSWLIWNLTGGKHGGVHVTDVSNASRTMLMNLTTLNWDPVLLKFFDIPIEILPEIRSCSEIYGAIVGSVFDGVPISGCIGDQQAALLGQKCFEKGQAKCTYGTGSFLMYNTGKKKIDSKHGLLTTVAYQLGKDNDPVYALEGSAAVAGAAFNWLKDNIGFIKSTNEIEELANEVDDTGDIYFVPAFSGLYAPYWQPNARGTICGITEETKKSHIIRAALEAICFQTNDILDAMYKDCGYKLKKLKVDGGMIRNNLFMQLHSDLCGIPVVRMHMAETTSLGAAMAAGSARGVDVWDIDDPSPDPSDTFLPQISDKETSKRYVKWKLAIERSLDWVT